MVVFCIYVPTEEKVLRDHFSPANCMIIFHSDSVTGDTDNLLMLTLSRGGPIVWMSETDAASAGVVDNDWVEAFNANGALVARAVVSQRMKEGTLFMYHA